MPKVVNHDQRRADLALLTLEAISAVGVERTTIREIARRGRLSMGMLTHYFTSKDDLVAFAFRWLSERNSTLLDKISAAHSPGLPRLEAAVEMQSKAGEPGGIGLWLSVWDRAVRNALFAREHRTFYARWREYVRTCLADAVALKQIPPTSHLDEATDLIVAAVDGIWIGGAFEPRRFTAVRRQSLLGLQIVGLTRQSPRVARTRAITPRPDH